MGNESIKEYYEKNKEWLQKVAQSSDIVVRSIPFIMQTLGELLSKVMQTLGELLSKVMQASGKLLSGM